MTTATRHDLRETPREARHAIPGPSLADPASDPSATAQGPSRTPRRASPHDFVWPEHDLLTAEQERELARRRDEGDVSARNELVCRSLRLGAKMARDYVRAHRRFCLSAAEAAACEGLIRAADKFDPSLGCRFGKYLEIFTKGGLWPASYCPILPVSVLSSRPRRPPDIQMGIQCEGRPMHGDEGESARSQAIPRPARRGSRLRDLVGRTFGRLTVLSHVGVPSTSNFCSHYWVCRCECGVVKSVASKHLNSGKTLSCGCLAREQARAKKGTPRTHGLTGSSTFNIWQGINQRCNNPRSTGYPRYGQRGIKVHPPWLGPEGFSQFVRDMGPRPPGHSIDRIDNDGDYEPGNCRWATTHVQNRNKSTNVRVLFMGEPRCLKDCARLAGLPYSTVQDRLNKGWDAERALTTPARVWAKSRKGCGE